jgi:hypothetical protein
MTLLMMMLLMLLLLLLESLLTSTCAGRQIQDALSPGEKVNKAAAAILALLALPRLVKRVLSFFARTRDPLSSELFGLMNTKTVLEERQIVVARDAYRAEWHRKWVEEGLDFVLTVPVSLPAMEHGQSEKTTTVCAGYTFLFSLVRPPTMLLAASRLCPDVRLSQSSPARFRPSESESRHS